MKCEFKVGCVVSTRMQITDKISVDLSHVDRCPHESSGDRSFLGRHKCDVGRQLEISAREAVRVTAAQIKPSGFPSDFEAEAGVLVRYATVNVGREQSAETSLSQDAEVSGSFTPTLLPSARQFDSGPPNLGAGGDLEDRSEDRLHHIERMPRADGQQVGPRRLLIEIVIEGSNLGPKPGGVGNDSRV